jgi:hypothetical protein
MTYSRRQLYELGEPFGESATHLKLGGRIYGGGSSAPSETKQTTVTELPEWARPYAKDILSKGSALTDINQNQYQAYGGNRVAGFSPLQTQAMGGAQNMQTAEQGQAGTALSALSGLGGLNVAGQANAQGFQNQVGGYMNPYLQMSLAPQLAEANRGYDISGTKQQSAATQAGAFGGSREAIMAAENERNRNMGLQNIVGQGYNTAFNNAQNQYNQNLGTQLQGFGMANQAAGTLGNLGGQQFQQGMDINKLQSGYGAMQQAQQQQGLDVAYQDFQNQKNYPYRQLGYMSDLLRGTPTGSSGVTNMYAPPANVAGQIAGLGIGAMGLSKFMAEGGMADGGPPSVEDPQNIEAIVSKLSDAQLLQSLKAAMQRGDAMQIQAIKQEQAMRASERNGLASAVSPDMADQMMPSAANGGIVAFGDGGGTEDYFQDPLGAPSYTTNDLSLKKDIRIGEVYKPDLQSMLFGTNTLPAREKVVAPAIPDTDKAERADRMTGDLTPESKSKSSGEKTTGGGKVTLPKNISSAVKEVSQATGVPQKTLREETMDIYKELRGKSEAELKGLNDAIESRKDDASKIKDKGLSEALMQFGFNMAANAAKPGAKFTGSAAAAAPVLGQVASENEKLQRAATDNYTKLKMDQTRYQVALDKGDMQTATAMASNIRQGEMQQKQLDAQVQHWNQMAELQKQQIAATSAYHNKGTSIQQVADDLAKDPANEKLGRQELLEKAAKIIQGASYARTDVTLADKIAVHKEKDRQLSMLNIQLLGAKTPEQKRQIQNDIMERERQIENDLTRQSGGGGQSISSTLPSAGQQTGASMSSKGYRIIGTE